MRKIETYLIITLLSLTLAIAAVPIAYAASHTDVDVATAWNMMTSSAYPNLVILDVRNQSEYDTGYIARAKLVPVWQLQQRIGELSAYQNSEILVYCKTGGRSHNASLILDANDFTKVYDLTGGITAWNSSGYPIILPPRFTPSNWTLVTTRGLKAYPDLRETVWQKNASMAPNGPYDKIGLHRLVKTGITPKGVVFFLPGTWGNAESYMSNPPSDNWTRYENFSPPIYWANRGLDVYGIDYRTHFVPSTGVTPNQTSFMANWSYDQWVSDIKEAVDKAKEVSGAQKVFMSGKSFGGGVAMHYAAKYWQQDLRGIIMLDGGNGTANTNPTNTYNLTAEMKATRQWSIEWWNATASLYIFKYAFANPDSPAVVPYPNQNHTLQPPINPMTNRTWANITEWCKWKLTQDQVLPIDYWAVLEHITKLDRYWPMRLLFGVYDYAADFDWVNCPYEAFDYSDHYSEINVPFLGFTSELFGIGLWGNITRGIASTDVTGIFLPKYSHGDVDMGVYSARDVSQPALDWMLNRYQAPAASAFTNVTVLTGWTWHLFAHSKGGIGSHTYQWYEGTTLLQGQTRMVLPVTKSTPGVYTFTCKITDSEGTTTNSNAVTLTVIG